MIYICEYDGTGDREALLSCAGHLPLECPEGEMNELRWKSFRQRILAWLLLDYGLEQEYGRTVEALEIHREEKGKPFSSRFPEICFNISHCDVACACMVSRESCGIDVERLFPYRESLAGRVCHEEEWKHLAAVPVEERQELLRALWSLKESYVKENGRGLGYGMNQINLSDVMGRFRYPAREMGQMAIGRSASWFWSDTAAGKFQLQMDKTYTLAACCREVPAEIVRVSEDSLCSRYRNP